MEKISDQPDQHWRDRYIDETVELVKAGYGGRKTLAQIRQRVENTYDSAASYVCSQDHDVLMTLD